MNNNEIECITIDFERNIYALKFILEKFGNSTETDYFAAFYKTNKSLYEELVSYNIILNLITADLENLKIKYSKQEKKRQF